MAGAGVVELLDLGRHLVGGSRGGDAIDHGPEVRS